MAGFVTPKTFLLGFSKVDMRGMQDYLEYTKQTDFLATWKAAKEEGLSDAECLCSFYAKLCYKSLVLGKNSNISRIRDIHDNLASTIDTGHGSVLEHCNINFVATDVSRVLTHELVRMRAGWAYSQTSGRYSRLDEINLVLDPILEGCEDILLEHLIATEKAVYLMECRKGLRRAPEGYPNVSPMYFLDFNEPKGKWIPNEKLNFDYKKKVTSAARRIAPNGQSNEIGFSINLRAIRHFIQLRTAAGAEWEIRLIGQQVYELLQSRFPLLFHGAKTRLVNGLIEVYGMKIQPWELQADDPKALEAFSDLQLQQELTKRTT